MDKKKIVSKLNKINKRIFDNMKALVTSSKSFKEAHQAYLDGVNNGERIQFATKSTIYTNLSELYFPFDTPIRPDNPNTAYKMSDDNSKLFREMKSLGLKIEKRIPVSPYLYYIKDKDFKGNIVNNYLSIWQYYPCTSNIFDYFEKEKEEIAELIEEYKKATI